MGDTMNDKEPLRKSDFENITKIPVLMEKITGIAEVVVRIESKLDGYNKLQERVSWLKESHGTIVRVVSGIVIGIIVLAAGVIFKK